MAMRRPNDLGLARRVLAAFVLGALLALALSDSGRSGRARGHAGPARDATLRTGARVAGAEHAEPRPVLAARHHQRLAERAWGGGTRPRSAANVDPDARDPSLRRLHLALLRRRPLLQLLPFSDHEVGIALVGAAPGGEPVLLVTYSGSEGAARGDVSRIFIGAHDSTSAYVVRYRKLGPPDGQRRLRP
jgi:hypothetical protein